MAALVAGALEHVLVKPAGKLNACVRTLGRGVTGLSARLVLRLASAWCDALGVVVGLLETVLIATRNRPQCSQPK